MGEKAKLSALVLGGTGEVGREVVNALASNENFQRVVLLGRRKLDLNGDKYKKIQEEIVDFEKLSDSAEKFQGFDVTYCCLGTTRGKSGAKGFVRVDHDYVVESAQLAKSGGCHHFNLVTSQGSNKNSWFLYPKVKGQVEEEITKMDFPRLSIYRPALLLCDRQESRPAERALRAVVGTLDSWGKLSVSTTAVAQAMINNTLLTSDKKVEILENADIHRLAKMQ